MWNVVVIGGGITGLTTAYALARQAGREVRVCVVESSARPGGKVVSDDVGGFLVEGGPDTFLERKPWALELVRELGLGDQVMTANEAHRTTYVLAGGRLAPLPQGLRLSSPRTWTPYVRSPLLSPRGKLRVLLEPFRSPRRETSDESVADFVRRRFGREALERLGEPLLAHVHAADIERMSLEACYPQLAGMEQRHGSLANAMRALRRPTGLAPVPPRFLTLRGGLGEIVERLADRLPPESRRFGRSVTGLERTPGGDYVVRLDDGTSLVTQAVVLAVPAFAAAALTAPLDGELARRLGAIRYVSLATLSLGYRRREIDHPLAGYGFFVPRREKRSVLASTWTSSKYPGRAPDDEHVLLRVFLGGALDEELLDEDDETLVARVRDDLRHVMGIRAEPVLERLYRWRRGYPQYEVGHLERVREIEAALPPGLEVAGSAYHGVGLPDCIRSGREAAARVLAGLGERVSEVDAGALAC